MIPRCHHCPKVFRYGAGAKNLYSLPQVFSDSGIMLISPNPPLKNLGNYKELLLKYPFEEGGFRGIFTKTSEGKALMATAIIGVVFPTPFPEGTPSGQESLAWRRAFGQKIRLFLLLEARPGPLGRQGQTFPKDRHPLDQVRPAKNGRPRPRVRPGLGFSAPGPGRRRCRRGPLAHLLKGSYSYPTTSR
jgi:hypothetical protein